MMMRDLLTEIPRVEPDRVGVFSEGEEWSWGTVDRVRTILKETFDDLRVPEGGHVGAVLRTRFRSVVAEVATISLGRTLVPFSPFQPDEVLCRDIESNAPRVVIGEPSDWTISLRDVCRRIGASGLVIHPEAAGVVEVVAAGQVRQQDAPVTPDIAARVLTSGTTGMPKRIEMSHATLDALAKTARRGSGDGLSLKSRPWIMPWPLVHASGFGSVLRAIAQGRPLLLMDKFEPDEWSLAIERHGIKWAMLIPAAVQMLVEAAVPAERFRSATAFNVGSAALAPDLARRFEEMYRVPLLPYYSATEFPGGLAALSLQDHGVLGAEKRGTVGKPFPGVTIDIVDPDTQEPLSPGELGLLAVHSKDSESDRVVTNDIASFDEEGFLYIWGRADDAIIRGGFKVLPQQVEAVLSQHPLISSVGVVGLPDERLGQVPVAGFEASGEVSDDELRQWCRDRLAPYQVPTRFVQTSLPRTVSMKISKPRLVELLMDVATNGSHGSEHVAGTAE